MLFKCVLEKRIMVNIQLKILHNSFAIPRKNQMQCKNYVVKKILPEFRCNSEYKHH